MPRREYVVYLDESFVDFLNFPQLDGHITYAALMLPKDRESDLARFWTALSAWVREKMHDHLGITVTGEIKSSQVAKLASVDRTELGRKINYFVQKNAGFVAGFHTSVHGLLCWELRTRNSDGQPLPAYSLELLEAERVRMRAEKQSEPGEAKVLGGLVATITSVPLNLLSSANAAFHLHYDGRNKKEDSFILERIDEFFPKMGNVGPRYGEVYLGSHAERDSTASPGIQLADVVCGYLRDYYLQLPELTREHSVFRTITPDSREGRTMPTKIGGHWLKWGSAHSMSPNAVQNVKSFVNTAAGGRLFPSLADLRLSCFGHFGESRVVNFRSLEYEDGVD